jgi:hypothetical protein
MKTPFKMALALFLACLLLAGNLGRPSTARAEPAEPVVQAVLFYRSSCSHCVQLVVEVMPPILQKYGRQLQVFYCDVSTPQGDALFTSAIDRFKIETIGTPTLIIGSDVLIGSVNIADKFPGRISPAWPRRSIRPAPWRCLFSLIPAASCRTCQPRQIQGLSRETRDLPRRHPCVVSS